MAKAAMAKPDFCFPNKMEELQVLQEAVEMNPSDSKAWYYLGNYWYGGRQHKKAIQCWEKSVVVDDSFPTVHRNLALAYFNKNNDPQATRQSLEKRNNFV